MGKGPQGRSNPQCAQSHLREAGGIANPPNMAPSGMLSRSLSVFSDVSEGDYCFSIPSLSLLCCWQENVGMCLRAKLFLWGAPHASAGAVRGE